MSLPDYVFFEILLRSPVKSLMRFRCVCKDWFTEITSPVFKEKHLAHRLSRYDESLIIVKMRHNRSLTDFKHVLTCYDDYESLTCSKSSYSHDMGSRWPLFATHVNGIVCLFCIDDNDIVLFNPALRETREVPDLGIPGWIRAVGFGFDDSTKDYIVVQIVSFSDDPLMDHRCSVYHLMTDAWTMVDTPAFMTGAPYFSNPIYPFPFYSSFFSHGSIHWCMKDKDRILAFNTTSKLFREIEFPDGWNDYYKCQVFPHLFKVDNSCIALVAECEHVLDVWLMKEYGVRESWTKQYIIGSSHKPLYFLKTNKLLLVAVDEKKKEKKMVCYDLSKGQQSDCLPYSWDSMPTEVVTCYESCFSIKKSLH